MRARGLRAEGEAWICIVGAAGRLHSHRGRKDRKNTRSASATSNCCGVSEVSSAGQRTTGDYLVSRGADSHPPYETRDRGRRNCLGLAEQRENPSDAEESVLCRSLRVWQDRGAPSYRGRESTANFSTAETA